MEAGSFSNLPRISRSAIEISFGQRPPLLTTPPRLEILNLASRIPPSNEMRASISPLTAMGNTCKNSRDGKEVAKRSTGILSITKLISASLAPAIKFIFAVKREGNSSVSRSADNEARIFFPLRTIKKFVLGSRHFKPVTRSSRSSFASRILNCSRYRRTPVFCVGTLSAAITPPILFNDSLVVSSNVVENSPAALRNIRKLGPMRSTLVGEKVP